jgi:hypothetical protein
LNKAAVGQIFLRVFQVSPVSIIFASIPVILYLHVALTGSNDGQKASVLETSTVLNVRVSMVSGKQQM